LQDAQKTQKAAEDVQQQLSYLLNEILQLSEGDTESSQYEKDILLILRHNFGALPSSSVTLKASANIIADKIRSDGYKAQESELDLAI
ncbi:hypothetical protein, partial [Photobacterium sanctipauli]